MSVTLLEVWRAARARAVPFSGETAGFLGLALCEEVQSAPRRFQLGDVELAADGSVRLHSPGAADAAQAELELRALLARLLEVASSPGPALFRAAGRAEPRGLGALDVELRQALIPFNRAAARRALLRLYRETERAVSNGQLGAPPNQGDSSSLLRVSPPPPPIRERTPPQPKLEPSPVPVASPAERDPTVAPVELARVAEQLTRPDSVVGFVKRGRTLPPPSPAPTPLPSPVALTPSPSAATPPAAQSNTPRMGSMDVDVVVSPSDASAELTDFTERAPAVLDWSPAEPASIPLAVTPLLELAVHPVVAPPEDAQSSALPAGSSDDESASEERASEVVACANQVGAELELELDCDVELELELEPEQSVALAAGVDAHEEVATSEAVADDELETRPLHPTIPAPPYAGTPPRPTQVDDLLQDFQVAAGLDEQELRQELKTLAGVDCTPGYAARVRSR